MKSNVVLGIDVGGSGIKGAPVDTKKGIMLTERHRIETPQPATPEQIALTITELVGVFDWKGPIGVGFPAAVQNGIVQTASNIDASWIGVHAEQLFADTTDCSTLVMNDADVAGVAEMKYGAGQKKKGLVVLVTVGSGIGIVMFTQKKLVPNMELGHIIMPNGKTGEAYAADRIRKEESLSWEQWGKRFNEYLCYLETLLYPDLFIVGGGVSKKMENFRHLFCCQTKVVPATLLNEAGIIGAAYAAKKRFMKTT